jgi:hypothetical protein
VVLPDTEVGVGNVSQFHGWRMGLKALKSKKLTSGAEGQRGSGAADRRVQACSKISSSNSPCPAARRPAGAPTRRTNRRRA